MRDTLREAAAYLNRGLERQNNPLDACDLTEPGPQVWEGDGV